MPKLKKSLKKVEGVEKKEPKAATVPAVKKLGHVEKKERWQGCRDVAALALEEEAVKPLLASRVCVGLAGLFGDESPAVRCQAVRALENVILSGEMEATEQFLGHCNAEQLLGHFNTLFAKLQAVIHAPPANQPKEKTTEGEEIFDDAETVDLVGDTLIAFVQLLGAVCYFSENVVNWLSSDVGFVSSIIQCTQLTSIKSTATLTLSTASSELLLILCDDNPTALSTMSLTPPEHQAIITQALTATPSTPDQALTQITLAGVMWQVNPTSLPKVVELVTKSITTLSPQIEYDGIMAMDTSADKGKAKEEATAKLLAMVKCLKTGLELCVNVVCSSEAANDQEDDEEMFKKSNIGMLLINTKFGEVFGAKAAQLLAPCPSEECEIALRDPVRSGVEDLQDEFSEVESAVIVLLMNLVMVLPLEMIGSPAALWKSLQAVFARDAAILTKITGKGETRLETKMLTRLENLCQCLWTVLRKDPSCEVDVGFITSLVQFVAGRRMNKKVVQSEGLVLAVLRFISEAAKKLTADGGQSSETVKLCGQLAMDCLRETSIELNTEAMISIIEIFSDDQWDEVMKSLNMTHHIVAFASFFQSKLDILQTTNAPVKEQMEARLDIVTSNLEPFIEYKKSRGL